MARELAERDAADVAALPELGDIFRDSIVERDLALFHRLRQQNRGEGLADGGEVEQRVRRDGRFARDVGEAVVEEERAAVDVERDRHAAGGDQHRLHLPTHDLLDLGVSLGARRDGCGECDGRDQRSRDD